MRIGMVTTQFAEVGGVENVVRELSTRMREDHQVELVTRERPQNAEEIDEFDKVHVIEDTDSYSKYLANGGKWFRENDERFDVLHFHNWSPILAARGPETPRVLTFHGTTLDVAKGDGDYHKIPAYWTLEQLSLTLADKVTSITRSHLEPFFVSDYEIIRNGVDTSKYAPVEGERKEELREKHRVEGKGILIVGQHEKNKGHRQLIEACASLEEEYTLMVPSTGPLREELEDLAEEKGVNAEFYGKIPEGELVELYQAADLFCLPSWNEGLPLSMLEAMSSGLPVVVSDVADNRQVVEEAGAGMVVEPENVPELEEKLGSMIGEGLEQESSNARSYAEEELDWSEVVNRYLETYEQVLNFQR